MDDLLQRKRNMNSTVKLKLKV